MASSAAPLGLTSNYEQPASNDLAMPPQTLPMHSGPHNELAILMAEVKRLQAETVQLRATNCSLDVKVQTVSKTLNNHVSGILFARFKDLPVEIRCQIWKLALTAPQIHTISSIQEFYSRSWVNNIMQTCHEAVEVSLMLQLPYFKIVSAKFDSDQFELTGEIEIVVSAVRNYMNYEEDIVWLIDDGEFATDSVVRFYCSKCPDGRNEIGRNWDKHGHHVPSCTCGLRLGGLATKQNIQYHDWRLEDAEEDDRIISSLRALHPRTLYVVNHRREPFLARDNFFVKSSRQYYDGRGYLPADEAAQDWTRWMESFKQKCTKEARDRISKGRKDVQTERLEQYSNWTIPAVRCVDTESVSLQRDWSCRDS